MEGTSPHSHPPFWLPIPPQVPCSWSLEPAASVQAVYYISPTFPFCVEVKRSPARVWWFTAVVSGAFVIIYLTEILWDILRSNEDFFLNDSLSEKIMCILIRVQKRSGYFVLSWGSRNGETETHNKQRFFGNLALATDVVNGSSKWPVAGTEVLLWFCISL